MKFVNDSPARIARIARAPRLRATAVAVGACAALVAGAAVAHGQSIGDLQSKIASAQQQAESLSADVQAKADQVAAAQQQAAAAAQREAELSALLAKGQQRSAELAAKVDRTQAHLQRVRAHLRRALTTLQGRLVSIYEGNAPDAAEILLNSRGFDDLANRAEM